jgi:hypothetical protein
MSFRHVLSFLMLWAGVQAVWAAEAPKAAPAEEAQAEAAAIEKAEEKVEQVLPSAPTPDPEVLRQWKSVQAQEQWVGRLKKQLDNETKQLSSQRAALAQNFKLDAKKLESGLYVYDEKTGQFSEKKK